MTINRLKPETIQFNPETTNKVVAIAETPTILARIDAVPVSKSSKFLIEFTEVKCYIT